MAQRLNKQLAIIATILLSLILLAGLYKVYEKFQPAAKWIADGDVAWEKQDYEDAKQNYLGAKARAKDDDLKIEVLRKLIDLYLVIEEWAPVRGCWQELLAIAPEDASVRYAQLKYFYIIANSNPGQMWERVESQATEFLEFVQDSDLMNADTGQWESPLYPKVGLTHEIIAGSDGVQRLGQYLYLLRGKARLQNVMRGSATDQDKVIEQAIEDLQEALKLDPTNHKVAWELARAIRVRGDLAASRGSTEQQKQENRKAIDLFAETVSNDPNNAWGQTQYLRMKQSYEFFEQENINLEIYEPNYLGLVEKFPNEAIVYEALSSYYILRGSEYIDEAIQNIEKASHLEPDNLPYKLALADLYGLRFEISSEKSDFTRKLQVLDEAQKLSSIEESSGPDKSIKIRNRIALFERAAWTYLSLLIRDEKIDQGLKAKWLEKAGKAVHELEQMLGSGEDLEVIKWRGLLELAQGQQAEAIKKLYRVYQRLEASNKTDARVAYILAGEYKSTPEIGAARDFYFASLLRREQDKGKRVNSIDRSHPTVWLDLSELLLNLGGSPLRFIDVYENEYGPNNRSRILRVAALIRRGEDESALAKLDEGQIDEPNSLLFKTQLLNKKINSIKAEILRSKDGNQVDPSSFEKELLIRSDELSEMLLRQLAIEPNYVSEAIVLNLCKVYEDHEKIAQAKNVAGAYLNYFPKNLTIKAYIRALGFSIEVSEPQLREIRIQILDEITEEIDREIAKGIFYYDNADPNTAAIHLQRVLEIFRDMKSNEQKVSKKIFDYSRQSVDYLFNIAARKKDIQMCQSIVDIAAEYNFDKCNGGYYKTRLFLIEEQYENALTSIEYCLEEQPIFSSGLFLRAEVNRNLDKIDEAIEDLKKALNFNPLNGAAAKQLAVFVYKRNYDLGSSASREQHIEAKEAAAMAYYLNPNDPQAQSMYADSMISEEPDKAIAMGQDVFRKEPSVKSALFLSNLALKHAEEQTDESKRKVFQDMAEDAYLKAMELEPGNQAVIGSYLNFCRKTGQKEKAEKLLNELNDPTLFWEYYFVEGKYDQAKKILEDEYEKDLKNTKVATVLLEIAQKSGNTEDVEKYSEALISLEDNKRNNLLRIQAFLNSGLIKEADLQYQSFEEKYPDEPIGQLLAAQISMSQGKYSEALRMVNKSLRTDETNHMAWLIRGRINLLMYKYPQAISDLIKSKSINDNPSTRVYLARAYVSSDRTADAIAELLAIVDQPATPQNARDLLESIYNRTGDLQGLQAFYDRMINNFPDQAVWYERYANLFLRAGDPKQAEKLYKKAWDLSLEQNSPIPEALDGYLSSLIERDKLQDAMKISSQYIESEYDYVALMVMGKIKAKTNDKAAAVDYFTRATDRVKDNEELASKMLQIMFGYVGVDPVRDYCEKNLVDDPDSLLDNYVLYRLSVVDRDYNNAIKYLDKYIQAIGPDTGRGMDHLASKGQLLTAAYEEYSDKSYIQKAIEVYEELLSKMPDNARLINNIAYVYAKSNQDIEKALGYIEKAYEIEPDNPAILDTYALVLYRTGRFDKAEEYAQAALQQYERNQVYAPYEMYENLALIMEKLEKNNEAAEAYKKAVSAGKRQMSEARIERIKKEIERLSN